MVPIEVGNVGEPISAWALIDSGAVDKFMELVLARHLHMPLHTLTTSISILGVSGEPLQEGKPPTRQTL